MAIERSSILDGEGVIRIIRVEIEKGKLLVLLGVGKRINEADTTIHGES